ncbi:transporter substrate-binding domain-containing protein [Streptococcus sp. X16XC17]|uniref:transporter substrate-binding domain-containing protein n=1 Tax=Streptococcus sp. X16XC17 TaxID=2316646 RepID=UPI0013649AB9|nr:transporter substrate-binding domain-containing protein [Streptococcus sp. X16XC17]
MKSISSPFTHNVLITRPELGENVTLEDLAGKHMGVVAGSVQSGFMEAYNKENPDKAIVLDYVDGDVSTIIQDVNNKRYDATIYATTYLKDVEKTLGIDLVGSPIADEDKIQPPGSHLLYRKTEEAEKLRNEVDAVLGDMRQDGTLSALSEKYFEQDDTQLTDAVKERNDKIEAKQAYG